MKTPAELRALNLEEAVAGGRRELLAKQQAGPRLKYTDEERIAGVKRLIDTQRLAYPPIYETPGAGPGVTGLELSNKWSKQDMMGNMCSHTSLNGVCIGAVRRPTGVKPDTYGYGRDQGSIPYLEPGNEFKQVPGLGDESTLTQPQYRKWLTEKGDAHRLIGYTDKQTGMPVGNEWMEYKLPATAEAAMRPAVQTFPRTNVRQIMREVMPGDAYTEWFLERIQDPRYARERPIQVPGGGRRYNTLPPLEMEDLQSIVRRFPQLHVPLQERLGVRIGPEQLAPKLELKQRYFADSPGFLNRGMPPGLSNEIAQARNTMLDQGLIAPLNKQRRDTLYGSKMLASGTIPDQFSMNEVLRMAKLEAKDPSARFRGVTSMLSQALRDYGEGHVKTKSAAFSETPKELTDFISKRDPQGYRGIYSRYAPNYDRGLGIMDEMDARILKVTQDLARMLAADDQLKLKENMPEHPRYRR
jgi:hypothetical protein